MRLFYFVKQHYAVGLAAYLFRKLTCIVIAHIAGRRADNTRYGVFFHKLRHIKAYKAFGAVKQIVGKHLNKLCFTHTRTARKNKGNWLFFVGYPCTTAFYGLCHLVYGFILTDNAALQFFFQTVYFCKLVFCNTAGGYPRPNFYNAGDIVIGKIQLVALF